MNISAAVNPCLLPFLQSRNKTTVSMGTINNKHTDIVALANGILLALLLLRGRGRGG
jgi:hypothetical protein